jgi:hypothetical protein
MICYQETRKDVSDVRCKSNEGKIKREEFARLTVLDLPYVRTLRVCAVSIVEQD